MFFLGTINHWVIPVICACIVMTFCAIGVVIYYCRYVGWHTTLLCLADTFTLLEPFHILPIMTKYVSISI